MKKMQSSCHHNFSLRPPIDSTTTLTGTAHHTTNHTHIASGFFVVLLCVMAGILLFSHNTAIPPALAQSSCTHYVATTGTDTNAGTQASPWRTIQYAVGHAPSGSALCVASGNYPERVTIANSGITIIGQGQVATKGFSVKANNITLKQLIAAENPNDNAGLEVHGDNNLFEDIEIYHMGQDGVWFFGSHNTFRGLYIHDILHPSKTGDPHVDCFQTWGWDKNTQFVLFDSNICVHNRPSGSNQITMIEEQAMEVSDLTFRNNIFVVTDPGYTPMNFNEKDAGQLIENITIVNNTFVHLNVAGLGDQAIRLINIKDPIVKNNIFYNYANGNKGYSYVSLSGVQNAQVSNNLAYNDNGVNPAGSPYPNDIWMQDPRFVNYSNNNPANNNYHLQASSPAIDAGAHTGVATDHDGNPRPQGARYDMGAYEYGTGPPSPSSPHLTLVKQANRAAAIAGSTLVYTLTLNNISAAEATDVQLEDALPSGVQFTSASDGGALLGGVVRWPAVASLSPASSAVRTFTVTVLP